jgi:hypothetical protein
MAASLEMLMQPGRLTTVLIYAPCRPVWHTVSLILLLVHHADVMFLPALLVDDG